MTDISVNVSTKVFNDVYIPQLENMARVQILFGGSSSGKSKFKAQQVIYDLMRGGRNWLVCRQVGRTIRGSVSQEINRVITEWGVAELFSINKTDGTITCSNGYQVIFSGLDDVEKLKSITPARGAITDIWVEEATETEQDSIKQLLKRQRGGNEETPKRLHLTFNPILQSNWIYTEYFEHLGWTETQTEYSSPDLSILKTTYKDNKFLTAEDRAGLENEKDEYYYQVYTLGNWGVLGDVIFRNWVVADLSDPAGQYYLPLEQRTNRRNGLDFGYSSNPAAAGASHYDPNRKRIYVYKELYETGLTNDILAERVTEMIGAETIVCDSAEPKSIQELRNHGVDAIGARKGKDSVSFGIDWLKQQLIIIDKSCINAQNEMRQYHWKKDAGGHDLNPPRPVDKHNHFIDGGLRYAYENDMEEIAEAEFGKSLIPSGYRG
jgi:phage terminase large subunit